MRLTPSALPVALALALFAGPAAAVGTAEGPQPVRRATPRATISVSDVTPTLGQRIRVAGHVWNETGRKSVRLQVRLAHHKWRTVQRFHGGKTNYRYVFKHTYRGHRAVRAVFRSRGRQVTSDTVRLVASSLRVGSFLNVTWGAPRDGTAAIYAESAAPEIVFSMIGSREGSSPCDPAMISGDPKGDVPLLAGGTATPSVSAFISTLKSNKTTTSFGFGGEFVPALWGNCTDSAQLQTALDQLASAYPDVQSWIFDIEATDQLAPANIDRLVQALAPVVAKHNLDIWWAVPVWPTGITTSQASPGIPDSALYALKQAATFSHGATIMCQAFPANYGTVEQMCEDAAQFVVTDPSQFPAVWPGATPQDLWAKLGLTVQTGVASDNPTPVTISQMGALRSFALKNDVGAILNWSLNQDFSANGICPVISATSPQYCLGASGVADQTRDWQFIRTAAGN